ncbi:hypothetical protein L873DRAFT_1432454 [Choiromyces venosus 120613-1]|uniref:Uncharacterized protein n=1 Tax=Choiromyces venosus 120613-1 TaxID=1336337 RepID=A0A3N4JKI5_9PEZI|nr:hypothetical protein L873DRAFT_1432454 [Choiromyces venosus 120613-1]
MPSPVSFSTQKHHQPTKENIHPKTFPTFPHLSAPLSTCPHTSGTSTKAGRQSTFLITASNLQLSNNPRQHTNKFYHLSSILRNIPTLNSKRLIEIVLSFSFPSRVIPVLAGSQSSTSEQDRLNSSGYGILYCASTKYLFFLFYSYGIFT